jgi:hypothetical protein
VGPLELAIAEGVVVHELLEYLAVAVGNRPSWNISQDGKAITEALL